MMIGAVAPPRRDLRERIAGWGRTRSQALWAILLPVVVVAALSAHRWSTVPLWRDEYATSMHASFAPADLYRAVSTGDAVQAPYYLLIHWLSPIFGLGEGMRLVSLLAVAGATAALAFLCLRWWGGVPALAAATFFAVNSNVVTAASTARPYALVLLAVALSLLMLDLALSGRRWAWPVYGLAAMSAVAMHLIATVAVASTVLFLLWRGRREVRRWIAWTAPAICATVAIGVAGFTQRGQIAWLIPMDVRSAVATLGATTGLSANRAAVLDGIALMLLAAAGALTIIAAWRLSVNERAKRTRPALVGLTLTFAAPIAMFAFSHVAFAVYLDRYLSWTGLGASLIVGGVWSTAITTRGAIAASSATVAIALSVASIGLNALAVREPPPLFDDVPALSDTMRDLVEPGDAIVVIETNPHFAVAYAVAAGLKDENWAATIREDLITADDSPEARQFMEIPPTATSTLNEALESGRRVWVVTLGSPSARDRQLTRSAVGCPSTAAWEPVVSYGLMHLTRTECVSASSSPMER